MQVTDAVISAFVGPGASLERVITSHSAFAILCGYSPITDASTAIDSVFLR
jgi:hypothetical protein